MTVSTGDILRIVATLLWTDGNVLQNVYNALITGGGGPWDAEDVIDDALEWIEDIYDNFTTAMSDEVDGSQIQGYVWDSGDEDWDEFASENWVFNPSNAIDQTARGVAGLVNLKSVDPDVSGKKYFGALCENNITDGLWGAGQVAGLVQAGLDWSGDFVGTLTSADFTPGIWSPTEEAFFEAGNVLVVPFIPAYQRRRKRGVGI